MYVNSVWDKRHKTTRLRGNAKRKIMQMLQIFTSSLRFLFIPLSFFVRFPRTLPLPSLALVLCFYLPFCSLFFPCRSSPSPFHISCRFSFRFFTLDIVLMFLTSVHVHIECIFMALKLYAEVLVFLLLLLFVFSLLRVFFFCLSLH